MINRKYIFQCLLSLPLAILVISFLPLSAKKNRAIAPSGRNVDLKTLHIGGDTLAAMQFLYDNMPAADADTYSPDFFLKNVEASLTARKEMPWGEMVPEIYWRHFVLPVRVNNEALDMARPQFYAELAPRVKGKTMTEALLEVNHWCHEKVTYRPSDGRTSSPLSTVWQAIGRCGEESTFAVAALRAVGIPARQVYTPRWAHTDDNHAWVEAWADGKWHFIGACEPEPLPDLAWFNAPAARGMLMTTNVFGNGYQGPEERLRDLPNLTTINVTANYAPVDTLKVVVKDARNNPVEGASVRFCIYNYADFYPVVTKKSDADGKSSIVSGLGDMVVWAYDKEGHYGFMVARPDKTKEYELTLSSLPGDKRDFEIEVNPPVPGGAAPQPTDEQRVENTRRFAEEDSIRGAYEATFVSEERAREIAALLALPEDSTVNVLTKARGNSRMLAELFASLPQNSRIKALRLLSALPEKDMRDISESALLDHLNWSECSGTDPFEAAYIMSPRIDTEVLTPFRSFFIKNISEKDKKKYRKNPEALASMLISDVEIDTTNVLRLPVPPQEAWNAHRADVRSKGILFVAIARSLGVPARFDPLTSRPQYADASRNWHDVALYVEKKSDGHKSDELRSPLQIEWHGTGRDANPKYYHQFSILSLDGGALSQLDFEDGYGVTEINESKPMLPPGPYMIMSGRRMADGGVLVKGSTFMAEAGTPVNIPLEIREDSTRLQVIGNLDAELKWMPLLADAAPQSILSFTGRGYYVLGLLRAGHEPTSHALRDIALVNEELEAAGRPMLLLFNSRRDAEVHDAKAFPEMPSVAAWGVDESGEIGKALAESLALDVNADAPVFVVADSFGRVVWLRSGYSVGLGHALLDVLSALENK